MKRLLPIIASVVSCCWTSIALAQDNPSPIEANVALVSNYVYRGLTNTKGDAAIQGGFDYTHPAGFYAGVWGSNTSAPGSIEIDGYFGWRFAPAPDLSLELGYMRYAFPGHSSGAADAPGITTPDTDEIHATLGWKWFSLSYAHSLGNTFGYRDAGGSYYAQLGIEAPLADSGVTVSTHAGRQHFAGANVALWTASSHCSNDCLSYTDYAIGLRKTWLGLDFGIAWTNTNARGRLADGTPVYLNDSGDNIGADQWIVSVSRSF